ncbi:SMI1/KNR4 family protein [Arthrobacter methylotrophus]|uniref:SMI1/KNR4 family protein n=1 Tax=Arthrobacter methylotrophus TaxID=121291 RepID=UPI0031EFAB96
MLEKLLPGKTGSRVRDCINSVALPSNAQVESLFGWRNGTNTQSVTSLDDIHVFPGFYFLSIEDATANYRAFRNDDRWSHGWLPLFANGGGDFYVVDLASDCPGSVRHFRIDEDEHPLEFESIAAMATTMAAAFERGTFFVDSDGYLEMDDIAFAALAAELNPLVPWWNETIQG